MSFYAVEALRPIARYASAAPAGWMIEGDGWSMAPNGEISISEAKAICTKAAAALRVLPGRAP